MTGDNIKINMAEEMKRGDECIRAANHLVDGHFFNDAVSRAYYAAYHYARALLLTKELEPKSHRGLIQMIGLHFVKTGLLSDTDANHLGHLESFRGLSDYNSSVNFDAAQSKTEIARANEFINACKKLITKINEPHKTK